MSSLEIGIPVALCLLATIVGWRALRRTRLALRTELEKHIQDQQAACAQIRGHLALLEQSSQQLETAKSGFNRSTRSQALQLLRTGMSPDTAAATLGIPRNDARLLANVATVLQRLT